ncbi:MAG: GNAT family N-acetyltransferase [Dehalococcoidales bacterium]
MASMDFLPPPPKSGPGIPAEDVDFARERGFELADAIEPGPTVEVRDLFRRLYGPPEQGARASPGLADCVRLRAKARGVAGDGDEVAGSIEFRYWPVLGIGYVEAVHVAAAIRRHGLGIRLLEFAVALMRRRGADSVHAFIVSADGLALFTGAGFVAEAAEDASLPWRTWASVSLDERTAR